LFLGRALEASLMLKYTRMAVPLLLALAVSVSVHGHPARAESLSSNLRVAASVAIRCSVATGGVSFGMYDVLGANATAPRDAAGSISLICSPGSSIEIRLGPGLYPEPGSTSANPLRRMSSGTKLLRYNLYQDAARTIVWHGAAKGLKGGNTFPLMVPVYGRIPAGQAVGAGAYFDTVVATVYF
jgi:spore coat protein U-like protein